MIAFMGYSLIIVFMILIMRPKNLSIRRLSFFTYRLGNTGANFWFMEYRYW